MALNDSGKVQIPLRTRALTITYSTHQAAGDWESQWKDVFGPQLEVSCFAQDCREASANVAVWQITNDALIYYLKHFPINPTHLQQTFIKVSLEPSSRAGSDISLVACDKMIAADNHLPVL